MTFDELLNLVSSDKAPDICVDSRLVEDGAVFIAVKGTIYDGHDFIDQAVARGARYIVANDCGAKIEIPDTGCEIIIVEDSAEAAAILAQAGKGNPSAKLTNLAVTGTNGKTTVAYLVRSVIQTAGEKCGLIGTIVYDTGLDSSQADLTTPDSLSIAEGQQKMVEAGAKYMVIEASSHALSQNRLAGVNFKAAAFTNIAGDHLDYHKTKADYLAAKMRLFTSLPPDAAAVLNKQSPEAELIAGQTSAKVLWYAVDEHADISANVESMNVSGTNFVLEYSGQSSLIKTPLLGRYNISNHLAAAGLCLAAGFDLETIAAGLSALKMVPGRLEKIDEDGVSGESEHSKGRGPNSSVLIDYAHTDDALKNALSALKPFCKGTLYIVFGCGGDRDRT
ncbi:MAG: Mur ligase family protein, partial [Planctomycetota bacterium]